MSSQQSMCLVMPSRHVKCPPSTFLYINGWYGSRAITVSITSILLLSLYRSCAMLGDVTRAKEGSHSGC